MTHCPTCRAPFCRVDIEPPPRVGNRRRTNLIITGESLAIMVTCDNGHRWLAREARREVNRMTEYDRLEPP